MRRLSKHDDQGVTIIFVVVLLPVLLLMAALVLDGNRGTVAKRAAQNSADAAALAIGIDCAKTGTASSAAPYLTTGQTGTATDCGGGTVTATVSRTIDFVFAPGSGTATRSATAKWGALGRSTGTFPITVGTCAFTLQFNVKVTLHSYAVPGCPNPSGQFGFIQGGCGSQTIVAGQTLPGTTGNNLGGSGCTEASLNALLGQDVLVPVWDSTAGSGSNATYHVLAYAVFQFQGWSTNGGSNHGGTLAAQCDGTADGDPVLPAGVDKNKPCIRGIFKGYATEVGEVVPGLACKDNILACYVYLDH